MRGLSAALVLVSAAAAAPNAVTFHRDVMPILQKRCQECHRAGEAAPMALMTYQEARPWAKAIRTAVASRKMPPWHADPHYGSFENDRALAPGEIETLTAWADSGAGEGDPKDAPAPRTFAEGWTIGNPDVVIGMAAAEHKIPAQGTVEYTYFIVPTGFTEDKWIDKIEVRPGARSVVHHIVLMARPPGSKYLKDAPKGVPYFPAKQAEDPSKPRPPQGERGDFFRLDGSAEMVSVYVPGGAAYQTRPGQARLIKAGSDLIFQMHYTASGKETMDRSRVGIVFAKEAPKERVVNTFIANYGLRIPAGAAEHRVDARVTLQQDATLQTLFPHMHLRGKAFEYTIKLPDGERTLLMRVPRYDFNWQHTYALKEPMRLPKGTEITATAWFDNSPNNKANPNPAAEVHWGEQSWEEMLAGFVDLAIPAGMDPATLRARAR